jgi:hypothetical protein
LPKRAVAAECEAKTPVPQIEEFVALKAGRFELDCRTIELVQNKSEGARTFGGPGFIRQNATGDIEFKIYTSDVQNTDAARELQNESMLQPGKIVEAHEYFTLRATDYRGGIWAAERVLPRNSWYFNATPNAVLTVGTIEHLTYSALLASEPTHAQNFVRMHFFDSVDVPCTQFRDFGTRATGSHQRNFDAFEALKCNFEVRQMHDEFVIQATSQDALPPFFETRILEALQFILARSLKWRILVERRDGGAGSTQFSSPAPNSPKTRLDPPIGTMRIDAAVFTWQLFAQYLEYVTREATSHFWHPCSAQLHNACEASANSMDAWQIGLCVAVEGISNLLATDVLSDMEKNEVGRLQKLVKIWTKCRKWPAVLSSRAAGLLSQMHNARLQDRLAPLAKDGNVDPRYIRSWSQLRNQRVHARHYDPSKLSMNELQSILTLINEVTVMMYQIVFYLIGYTGEYTDYGTLGFPSRTYPLALETNAPLNPKNVASE